MLRKKAFWKKLKKETPKWVKAGMIDAAQQETILAQYAPKPSNVRGRLPALVIGLSVILIGVGLLLFYAANWRKMPPPFKLFQVFALMIGLYSVSYYFLAVREESERIGRAFLHLGMVAFGAGIALVAQIYHISAHPSNGVLLWAFGVLALAWVMRDRWGYYLAALLVFIWNGWEYFEYQQPNYLFVLFPVVLIFLFARFQEKVGVLIATGELIFWYHQINSYWITQFDQAGTSFLLVYIPFGLILIGCGRWGEQFPAFTLTSRVLTFLGWVSLFIPLITLSWPNDWFDDPFPWFGGNVFSGEFLVLTVIAGWLIVRRSRQHVEYILLAACLGYGVVCFVLPLGNITTCMVLTHLGLLAFFFGLLTGSYLYFPERAIERFLAFCFPIVMILSKGIGFLALGIDEHQFLVAYGIGSIIFGTVCLLLNQTVKLLVMRQNSEFPAHILNSVCAVMGFIVLYALSFKVTGQTSVFETSTVIFTLLGMFFVIALGLYLLLWLKSSEKLIVGLSAIVFFTSVIALLISGPTISWVVYALIFNILLFLMTATLIYYSTRINSTTLANAAILGFVVHIVTRYFDIFLDLFSGSLLFIITGLFALGGGYLLERNRRKLVQSIHHQTQEPLP